MLTLFYATNLIEAVQKNFAKTWENEEEEKLENFEKKQSLNKI